jgi:hypothetical protein
MTADIVSICRHLSGLHGGTDLPERIRTALDTQREQRVALAQAADVIQRQSGEIATLKARVRELELTLFDDGRDPTDCKDSGAAA